MKIPLRNRHWLKEVVKAYEASEKDIVKNGGDILDIYKLAPALVVKNRGMLSAKMEQEILHYAEDDRSYGKQVDPGSENEYKYHFVSTYVMGHFVAGLISEKEGDKIMEYICHEWDVFDDEEN